MWRGLLFLALFFLLFSCQEKEQEKATYDIPEKTDDGWEVKGADEVGLSSVALEEAINYIQNTPDHDIHSMLIVKDGNLVFETYFEGFLYSNNPPGSDGDYIQYNRETDHYLASVSKSVTSVLFGAAVKAGYIDHVEEKLVEVLPEYEEILVGEKADITLEHLLCMSSGLHWDESSTSYENPANDVVALFREEDPLEYILSKGMIASPGEIFLYNSGGTNVLGAVIERKTGKSFLDFGNEYLFGPLNVEGGMLEQIAGGYYFASGGFYLRPRELAKIGYLFLNDGYWKENQIISAPWIAASTSEHIATDDLIPQSHAYGYQWWIMDFHARGKSYECFFAAGWGDQYMFILPEHEMIIVIHCGNYLAPATLPIFPLVEDFFLPGLED